MKQTNSIFSNKLTMGGQMKKYLSLLLITTALIGCANNKPKPGSKALAEANREGSPLNILIKDFIATPDTNYIDLYYVDGELLNLRTYDYYQNIIEDVTYKNGEIIDRQGIYTYYVTETEEIVYDESENYEGYTHSDEDYHDHDHDEHYLEDGYEVVQD